MPIEQCGTALSVRDQSAPRWARRASRDRAIFQRSRCSSAQRRAGSGRDAYLLVDMADVVIGRAVRDHQLRRHVLLRVPGTDQPQNSDLPVGQTGWPLGAAVRPLVAGRRQDRGPRPDDPVGWPRLRAPVAGRLRPAAERAGGGAVQSWPDRHRPRPRLWRLAGSPPRGCRGDRRNHPNAHDACRPLVRTRPKRCNATERARCNKHAGAPAPNCPD